MTIDWQPLWLTLRLAALTTVLLLAIGTEPKAAKLKAVAKAPLVSAKQKAASPPQQRAKTVTASELILCGIPRHMLQSWLGSGVLLRTEGRGVYRTTRHTAGGARASDNLSA